MAVAGPEKSSKPEDGASECVGMTGSSWQPDATETGKCTSRWVRVKRIAVVWAQPWEVS